MPQMSFFSLPVVKQKQLHCANMELVCYVLWRDSLDQSFLDDMQSSAQENAQQHPEKDQ